MSEKSTPLTDAAEKNEMAYFQNRVVESAFARSLETVMHDLAEAGKEERGAQDHFDYTSSEFRCDQANAELVEAVSEATMRLHRARMNWDKALAAYDKLSQEGGTK